MEDLIEEKELDEAWIKDFEKDDEKFKIFYSDDVYYIKLHCINIATIIKNQFSGSSQKK